MKADLKGLARRVLIVVGTFALSACPLGSDFPLSSPSEAALDNSLTGSWTMRDPESGKQGVVSFLPFNEREFVVASQDPGDATATAGLMRAFVTIIDGARFLNLQVLEEKGSRTWSYANYSIEGDTLSVRLVDDALFPSQTFRSSDELREQVRKNLHDPRLYVSTDGKEYVQSWQRVKN